MGNIPENPHTANENEAPPPLLSDEHRAHLREGSGISLEVIEERGYRTITQRTALREYGFSISQCRTVPGLLIPQHGTDGSNGRYTFKPDQPRVTVSKRSNKERLIKYENPVEEGVRLDCPPRCKEHLGNPSIDLWLTEGTKKADAGASRGLCVVALNGVWGFKGKNEFGGITILGDWDHIALKGRTVNIAFDSDVMIQPPVKKALERLVDFLQRKGAIVNCVYLPMAEDGAKMGLDDYLLKHSVEELNALIQAPRPEVKAAPAHLELLEDAPEMMTRPLSMVKGHAHAAIWPYVRVTVSETIGKDGQITRHNPPIVREEQRLMIVRDDGLIFGDGKRELSEIGATIRLPEIPTPGKLWSTRGVKRHLQGERPSAADVFDRICKVIDTFIDFDKSLADQRGMCEMVACYILATWFLEGFNVIGYLWPNGERGSGKSQLLLLLAEMGYLGQFILAGGSFAALRDMADYGAFLGFDDAENLSDPKTTDPDKRTLLLAGNRRGSTIALKEQRPDGTWGTRHVNTYCARSFSAIRQPDSVLASRTITIPLIRSGDRKRANADPKEYDLWPSDRQALIDDLWALSVTHLKDLSAFERRVNQESELTGRNLEPWRAILAVALWLDENGIEGLSKRMRALSMGYQSERCEFESSDLTRLVIRAVVALADFPATSATSAASATNSGTPLATSEIANKAKQLAAEEELGINQETLTNDRVGRVLGRQRLEKADRVEGKKGRQWMIHVAEVARWKVVYSLSEGKTEGGQKTSGDSGDSGEVAETAPSPPPPANNEWLETAICKMNDSTHRERVTI